MTVVDDGGDTARRVMNAVGAVLLAGVLGPVWCLFAGGFSMASSGRGVLFLVGGIVLAVASVVAVVVMGRHIPPVPRGVLAATAVIVALVTGGLNVALLVATLPETAPRAEPEPTWPD